MRAGGLCGGAQNSGVFLALEPAVDEGLGSAGALHVGDDLGAGEGLAAVGDDFVELFVGAGHVWLAELGFGWELVAVSRRATRSLRLRLHSGLRQSAVPAAN